MAKTKKGVKGGKKKKANERNAKEQANPTADSQMDDFEIPEPTVIDTEKLSGPYLIQASFNFITRTIKDFEKLAASKQCTTILQKDVAGVQQLFIGLLDMNPGLRIDPDVDHYHAQITAEKELARAKRDGTPANLNVGQVAAVVEVYNRFPRNLAIDKRKRTHEPYIRLMTAAEKARTCRPRDLVINSSAWLHSLARRARELTGDDTLEKEFMDISLSSPDQDLDDLVLRLTPNVKVATEPRTSFWINAHLDRPPEWVHFEKGAVFQLPVRDKEAEMTKEDWRTEAKELEKTLIKEWQVWQGFIDSAVDFFPSVGQRCLSEVILSHILDGIASLSQERDSLKRQKKDLQTLMEKERRQESDTQRCIQQALQHLPGLPSNLEQVSIPLRLHFIANGIEALSRAHNDALKLNEPLHQEIASLRKKLCDEVTAVKSSQDGRDQDRVKHTRELEKRDLELMAFNNELKAAKSELLRSKQDSQNTIAKLSKEIAENKTKLGERDGLLEVLTADSNASAEENTKLKTDLVASETKVANLQTQLDESQGRLLSSRTNPQVEQDRIQKAVEQATATKIEKIKELRGAIREKDKEIKVAEHTRKTDEKTIRDLSQDKAHFKQKTEQLEEELANIAAVQEFERESQEGRVETVQGEQKKELEDEGAKKLQEEHEIEQKKDRAKIKRLEEQLYTYKGRVAGMFG